MTLTEYEKFLETKRMVSPPAGIADPPALHPSLFDFQRDITSWSLRRGCAALFEECGLGKSRQAIEWARVVQRETGRPVLIATPLAVARQFVAEGVAIDVEVTHCKEPSDLNMGGINVVNYERIERFDPKLFGGFVADECFAAGTLVDTPSGPVAIETLSAGHRVVNACGVDTVKAAFKREVPFAIKVTIGGKDCTCSPNHPFFTQRGWVGAQDLRAGDYALETAAAVCMVRHGFQPGARGQLRSAFLRKILLSEVEDEPTGAPGEGAHARGCCEARQEAQSVASLGEPDSTGGDRENQSSESDEQSGIAREVQCYFESDGTRTFRAWGKRAWFDQAATDDVGYSWSDMGAGVSRVVGPKDSRLSNEIQRGLSLGRKENRDRGGWQLALQQEAAGHEEGRDAGFVRVDGAQVLEQGDPELDCLRDAAGKLYFYDIVATRHPSFSVNGYLVHNSSIIKNHDSKTRNLLIESFRNTPFKLACTATPAPNDHVELGNHAEFLGVMTRAEMLSMFFVHDAGETQTWRLKGHARNEFWRWVCSWAVSLLNPRDLGYSGDGYDLPELRWKEHVIRSDDAFAKARGHIFSGGSMTLADRREARRASLGQRVALAAELANSDDEQWILWTDLNDESAQLTKLVRGAVEVKGADSTDHKESTIERFQRGEIRAVISKGSIFGFGVNLQNCHKTAFVGLSDSFEAMYQSVRRVWRFGQKHPVDAHIITSSAEGAVLDNVKRKQREFYEMASGMVKHMADISSEQIRGGVRTNDTYNPTKKMWLPPWLRK